VNVPIERVGAATAARATSPRFATLSPGAAMARASSETPPATPSAKAFFNEHPSGESLI
jgi:hypothetical protein